MYFNIVQPLDSMPKGGEASPSIILAGRALLVKMIITFEPRYAFGSNIEYFFVFFYLFIFLSFFVFIYIYIYICCCFLCFSFFFLILM